MNSKIVLPAILILCAILRVAYILNINTPIENDASAYYTIAKNIAAGNGITDGSTYALRPPVYPLFVAFSIMLFGDNPVYVKYSQVAVSVLLCFLIFQLGKILLSETAGIISAAIFAVDPFFIYFNELILSELLFTVLFTAFTYFLIKGLKGENDTLSFILAGLFIGLATQTRSTPFFLPLIFALIYFKKNPKGILLLLAVFISIIAVWVIRNWNIFRQFVPLSTLGGANLIEANNPFISLSNMSHWPPLADLKKMTDYFNVPEGLGEIETNRHYTKLAIDFMLHNPLKVIILAIGKFVTFWTPWPLFPWPLKIKILSLLSHGPVLALGIIGIYATLKKPGLFLVPVIILVYFTAMHMVFGSMIRFRIPLMPFVYTFTAYTLLLTYSKLKVT